MINGICHWHMPFPSTTSSGTIARFVIIVKIFGSAVKSGCMIDIANEWNRGNGLITANHCFERRECVCVREVGVHRLHVDVAS